MGSPMNFLEDKDKEGEEEEKMNILKLIMLERKELLVWRIKKPCNPRSMDHWSAMSKRLISWPSILDQDLL